VSEWLQPTTHSKWSALSVSFRRIQLVMRKSSGAKALCRVKIEFNTIINIFQDSFELPMNNGKAFNRNLEKANPFYTDKELCGLEIKMLTLVKVTLWLLMRLSEWLTTIFNMARKKYNLYTCKISYQNHHNTWEHSNL